MGQQRQLGLWALMAAIIGSVIGGAAFNLPKDMASAANSGAVMIAWLITGAGMVMLALVFQNLTLRKSELTGGIYSYARAGFGAFIGFNSAWGYWIASILGLVSFIPLLFSTLNYFYPIFGEGNNLPSLLGGTLFVWAFHFLVMRGVKEAAFVNFITTIGKLMPIFIFIIFLVFAFHRGIFFTDFWGNGSFSWTLIMKQVKDSMLVTLWAFVGIEGAVVLSGRAKRHRDVGTATVFGLLGTLLVYMLISILSLGVLSREQLQALPEPSMAYVLAKIVGPWGAVLINVGLIISIAGAMLSWILLTIEIPYVAAQDGMFPRSFMRENRKNTPIVSLWWTSLITEAFVIIVHFSASTYQAVYSMASVAVLIPYLLSTLYQLKLVKTGETYLNDKDKVRDGLIGFLAALYSCWLLYAAGLDYLLMVSSLYLAGFVLYIPMQLSRKRKLFKGQDWLVALTISGAGIAAIGMILTGNLSP
ncbi:amino acid permease [Thermoactinomyces daqus]|uniref:Amino acid permease n=1 Tax=Thermoactinomyces daqus TaxID=1329516 RepID=A0A7W1XCM9_9BACL|nr:basic amino acid/polyamine antiporter [Thermoactinomyces daqus]MBA4544173.1 amino acid permease [Thermoactinomyces daqus]